MDKTFQAIKACTSIVSPMDDSKWKIVPGLADSAGISFQSVNYPTRYLRQSSYNIVLAANDDTFTFKADALFIKKADLPIRLGHRLSPIVIRRCISGIPIMY